jgi:hypothetical protein
VVFLITTGLYRWNIKRRRKYCTIKSLFGGMKANKKDNVDPEETVALLTLGLKNFLPHMPQNNCPTSSYGAARLSRASIKFNRLF